MAVKLYIVNIAQLADGAAASLMCNQRGLEELGVTALARIIDWDDSALLPTQWPVAPAKGARQLLDRSPVSYYSDCTLYCLFTEMG